MESSKTGPELEEISEGECLQILDRHRIGRVGVVVDGAPQIFPVNYAMRDEVIVFRTAPGTKLSYAPSRSVCFEIDGYDSSSGVGWSVMAQGVAHDTTDGADDLARTAGSARPRPLAPGQRAHRVAIRPDRITGRRFRLHG
jgi:uncharacterized protein